MKNHDFRIAVFAVALLVSLGLFLGGYYINNELVARNTKSGLAALCGGPVQFEKQGKVTVISVDPGKVDNLQETWTKVSGYIGKDIASGKYRIVIVDKRNTELQKAFDYLQPAVYEAAANSTFVSLQRELDQYLRSKNIDYQIYIDNDRLYLQMEDGDYYLYQVIDRNDGKQLMQVEA
ncbi:MAG: hypothetical protein ACM3PE_09675 [Deltaproteobacteria bacterium]